MLVSSALTKQVLTIPLPSTSVIQKEQVQSKSSQFLKPCQLIQLAFLNMVTHLTMYQWKIRLSQRGVAYGAMFPDSIDTMHQANEFIALDDLFRAAAIYAEAIYELIK